VYYGKFYFKWSIDEIAMSPDYFLEPVLENDKKPDYNNIYIT